MTQKDEGRFVPTPQDQINKTLNENMEKISLQYVKGYLGGLISGLPKNGRYEVVVKETFFDRYAVSILNADIKKYSANTPVEIEVNGSVVVLTVVRDVDGYVKDAQPVVPVDLYKSDEDIKLRSKNIAKNYVENNPETKNRERRIKDPENTRMI